MLSPTSEPPSAVRAQRDKSTDRRNLGAGDQKVLGRRLSQALTEGTDRFLLFLSFPHEKKMAPSPSTNGRSANGQFRIGNQGGPGNPHVTKVGKLRSALLNAVTAADVRKIAKKLIELAIGGDIAAAKLLLDRSLGKVAEPSHRVSQSRQRVPQQQQRPENESLDEAKRRIAVRIARLAGIPLVDLADLPPQQREPDDAITLP